MESNFKSRTAMSHQLFINWSAEKLAIAFLELFVGHELQCTMGYSHNTWEVALEQYSISQMLIQCQGHAGAS